MIGGLTEPHPARISEWASRLPFGKAVYIFDPMAKSEATDQGDLDLAMEIGEPPGTGDVIALMNPMKAKLRQSLPLPFRNQIHVTNPGRGERIVWPVAVQDGIEIYRANP